MHEKEVYRYKDEISKMKGMSEAIATLTKTIEELTDSNQRNMDDIRVRYSFSSFFVFTVSHALTFRLGARR